MPEIIGMLINQLLKENCEKYGVARLIHDLASMQKVYRTSLSYWFTHCLEVQIKAGCDISLGKRRETDVKYILF